MQRTAQGEKPSEQVSAKHLRRRTSTIRKVGDTVSNNNNNNNNNNNELFYLVSI